MLSTETEVVTYSCFNTDLIIPLPLPLQLFCFVLHYAGIEA